MFGLDDATVATVVTTLGPPAVSALKKLGQTHSKVKRGKYAKCRIKSWGDKACIVVNENSGKVVLLTSDTIASCDFVETKFSAKGMKDYNYYDVTFLDGSRSLLKMSQSKSDKMEAYL